MEVRKHKFKDRSGKPCTSAKWQLRFSDHNGKRRDLMAFPDKRSSAFLGRTIEELMSNRAANAPLSAELHEKVQELPKRITRKLIEWGILREQDTALAKPLLEHLDDYVSHLRTKGVATDYWKQCHRCIEDILKVCGFVNFSDIDEERFRQYLDERRRTKRDFKHHAEGTNHLTGGLSIQTCNHYITRFTGFVGWIARRHKLRVHPLYGMEKDNAQKDRRHVRRASPVEKMQLLLSVTLTGPRIYGLTGHDRFVLYLVAIETGYRFKECCSIRVRDCHLDGDCPCIAMPARRSKHRRDDEQSIKKDTASLVRQYIGDRTLNEKVFRANCADRKRLCVGQMGCVAECLYPGSMSRERAWVRSGVGRAGLGAD